MGIEDQRDAPLHAIAALVRAAVHAELGEEVLLNVYEDPRSLMVLTAGELPAMCIYRKRRKSRVEDSGRRVQDITVAFQYMLPATKLTKRGDRWPALDAVWDVVERVVLDGHHPSVSSDADVLEAVALQGVEGTAQAENMFVNGGEQEYPMCVGSIVVTYRPDDLSLADRVAALDEFLELYTSFDEPNTDVVLMGDRTDEGEDDSTDIVTFTRS